MARPRPDGGTESGTSTELGTTGLRVELLAGLVVGALQAASLNVPKLRTQIALALGFDNGLTRTTERALAHRTSLIGLTLNLRSTDCLAHLRGQRLLNERRHVACGRTALELPRHVRVVSSTQRAAGGRTGQTHAQPSGPRRLQLLSTLERLLLQARESCNLRRVKALPLRPLAIALVRLVSGQRFGFGQRLLGVWLCPVRQVGYLRLRGGGTATTRIVNPAGRRKAPAFTVAVKFAWDNHLATSKNFWYTTLCTE